MCQVDFLLLGGTQGVFKFWAGCTKPGFQWTKMLCWHHRYGLIRTSVFYLSMFPVLCPKMSWDCHLLPEGYPKAYAEFSLFFLFLNHMVTIILYFQKENPLNSTCQPQTVPCTEQKLSGRQEEDLGLWKWLLNSKDLKKTRCSYRGRANLLPHQALKADRGRSSPRLDAWRLHIMKTSPKQYKKKNKVFQNLSPKEKQIDV